MPNYNNKPKWQKTIFNVADGIITPCNVAWSWHWFCQVTAPCNVAGGSGMTCHGILPNVRHIGILHLFSILSQHVILHQSAKFYPNRTTLSIKMTEYRFKIIRWRISAILDFKGPIMGSFKSRCKTFYRSPIDNIALNYLSFWENSVFCILATDRQTNEQMDTTDTLSRSRYRERRLNYWHVTNADA